MSALHESWNNAGETHLVVEIRKSEGPSLGARSRVRHVLFTTSRLKILGRRWSVDGSGEQDGEC